MDSNKISSLVEQEYDELIKTRRYFHENPELSGHEYNTSEYIRQKMAELGLEPVWVFDRISAYYELDTGKPGKTLALRADIDALPVEEDSCNLKSQKSCVSKVSGVSHMCGHDGHTAMLLTAAKIIVNNKDSFCGRIIFFFEASEEGCPGVDCCYRFRDLLKEKNVDAIWGIHLTSFMDVGTISVEAGPRMAQLAPINIEITGRGGHASRPDLSLNPVLTAAEVACKLQSIMSVNMSPFDSATLAITAINGGCKYNIIPDKCQILGNVRFCSLDALKTFAQRIPAITDGICRANNCDVKYVSVPQYTPDTKMTNVNNDPALSRIAEDSVDKILPGARVLQNIWMASESFGLYQSVIPGVFAFVGIRNDELGSGAEHHNSKFDMDERALAVGVKLTVQFVFDYLNE